MELNRDQYVKSQAEDVLKDIRELQALQLASLSDQRPRTPRTWLQRRCDACRELAERVRDAWLVLIGKRYVE